MLYIKNMYSEFIKTQFIFERLNQGFNIFAVQVMSRKQSEAGS